MSYTVGLFALMSKCADSFDVQMFVLVCQLGKGVFYKLA